MTWPHSFRIGSRGENDSIPISIRPLNSTNKRSLSVTLSIINLSLSLSLRVLRFLPFRVGVAIIREIGKSEMSEPPPFQEADRCDVCNCSFSTFRRRVIKSHLSSQFSILFLRSHVSSIYSLFNHSISLFGVR